MHFIKVGWTVAWFAAGAAIAAWTFALEGALAAPFIMVLVLLTLFTIGVPWWNASRATRVVWSAGGVYMLFAWCWLLTGPARYNGVIEVGVAAGVTAITWAAVIGVRYVLFRHRQPYI